MTTEQIKNRFSRISLAGAWVLTLFLALTSANAGDKGRTSALAEH